jgi:hypothetical protein
MNGTVPPDGPTTAGTARLLDEQSTSHVLELMKQRFCMYRLVRLADRILCRERPLVAIAITR